MKKLNKKDINCLLSGNTYFATGGGFPSEKAHTIFEKVLRRGSPILKSLDEFEDDDYLCVASGVGSVKKTDIRITQHSTKAIALLENIVGHKIKGLVSGEIGLECLAAEAASKLGLPLVDADMKGGRAAPEPSINMFNLMKRSVTPMVAINTDGDISILQSVSDAQKIELFLRHFANMAGGCFVAWCPRKVREYKQVLIRGTVSRAIDLGKDIIQKKPLEQLLRKIKGKVLFEGNMQKIEDQIQQGFLLRKITINNGHNNAHIWIKNENLVLLINNVERLTCPDLITLINPKNNLGIHNAEVVSGQNVVVVGIPHAKVWHTKAGYKLFGPSHFNLPFVVKHL